MRTIDAIDFFYLSMPVIEDIGDGSQDALLVRIEAGGEVGWGECEASPLPTIASLICPMSHSACKPVSASVLGQPFDSPEDIARIHQLVRQNSADLLQADHALSGIDVALWDLLGKLRDEPTYRLLGYSRAYPKVPYASFLFGDTPAETCEKARRARELGFRAVKFGWGPFGRTSAAEDADQLVAAREGLGPEGILCVDAGTVWGTNLEAAYARLNALRDCRVTWLEEPFHTGALQAYRQLARKCPPSLKLAGGEGAHNEFMASHMIDYADVGFIQIDTGRVGGITSARRIVEHALARGVIYVNHTFTSHLALSASLQPYAGIQEHFLCEYPAELKPLAWELTREHLIPDENGEIHLPDRPGLGFTPDPETMLRYRVEVEIMVNGEILYHTPHWSRSAL
jgi:L-alanine-DL-glutamate epimerase-like enolase superfamily enzyme